MSHSINIVSFDVPFPANYGGVIDVYYKLYWLKRSGVKIHLHCFAYGRKPSPELEALCEKVHYYQRNTGVLSNLSLLPYNVKSRQSGELEKNLLSNDFPILFEVLHTCYLLKDERFKNRKKVFRHSNIEHEYYLELSRTERSFLKRIYLRIEAWKLKRFEPIVSFADLILAVNEKDSEYFKQHYKKPKTVYLPSFHQNGEVSIKPGKGSYLLFHGNLGIPENYEAAVWLTEHVFSKIKQEVVIAGLNPPGFLHELVKGYTNIKLIANPGEKEMRDLTADAHIHVLYTAQATGLKLKLLNVLFGGRFIVCNGNMISGTPLQADSSLAICEKPDQFILAINKFMTLDLSAELLAARTQQTQGFNNMENAAKLIGLVFGSE